MNANKLGISGRIAAYFQTAQITPLLVPLGQLNTRFHEVTTDKNQSIAVICRSGVRSATAVQILHDAGFNNVCNVNGGTLAWFRAGLPVVRKQ
jgi:rhodanese-related sulfurtransferase